MNVQEQNNNGAFASTVFYGKMMLGASFLVPLYIIMTGSLEMSNYFEIMLGFLKVGGACLMATFLTAIFFELIDKEIKERNKAIGLKILFVVVLFAVSYYSITMIN